jgi:hypothetical protein
MFYVKKYGHLCRLCDDHKIIFMVKGCVTRVLNIIQCGTWFMFFCTPRDVHGLEGDAIFFMDTSTICPHLKG